ncbi:MAG: heteromeric transposase endonuclease subunit TnsA [Rhodospirillales bacterium]|nr:heteromeric transposase endonuclease subunit TnsA [Rhodospirillales bacterium]
MASRYGFDAAKIERFHKEGRGTGVGADYMPWLTVQDVASRGRSQRTVGSITGRIHHLLSDLERRAFLIFDHFDGVKDIREQFPLDLDETRAIAAAAAINHPVDVKSRHDLVQTTDLVIDLERDGRVVLLARAVKPSSDLAIPRVIEKLEIERRYWGSRGIDWGVITEKELPQTVLRNLEMLQASSGLDKLVQPYDGYYSERARLIAAELDRAQGSTLQGFCQEMDARLGLERGGALFLVRNLLATKVWRADLTKPITDDMPMSAFWRSSHSDVGRMSA